MVSLSQLSERMEDDEFYRPAFGNDDIAIADAQRMMREVYKTFVDKFGNRDREVHVDCVKNRIEYSGKHTDYGGGMTLSSAGNQCFVCISALRDDQEVHMIDANPIFGEDEFELGPDIPDGDDWRLYTRAGYRRLWKDLERVGYNGMPKGIDAAFMGNIPIGGGTSGSSAKVITDFFALARPNYMLENPDFRDILMENAIEVGMNLDSSEADEVDLALSMYLSCFENGKPFGNLTGGEGVGTFGGSLDHTSIILCQPGRLLLAKYCPTEILDYIDWPKDLLLLSLYTGARAEKTKGAQALYNFAAKRASLAVDIWNAETGSDAKLLRDIPIGFPISFFDDFTGMKSIADVLGKTSSEVRAEYGRIPYDNYGLAERFQQFTIDNMCTDTIVRALHPLKADALAHAVNLSHEMSRNCLWNVVPETDHAQKAALSAGALCSSAFGAGGGGSTHATINPLKTDTNAFKREWKAKYLESFPQYADSCQVIESQPSAASMPLFED